MKKYLTGILFLVVTILLLGLFWNSSDESTRSDVVSYKFDCKKMSVQFVANDGYVFTDIASEYDKLDLPDIADETVGAQTVSISLDPLPLRDGEFIYLHLRKHDGENRDFQIQIYEILYQSEKELYIARCKNRVGGIYEWVDIYNPKTGELSHSR